MQELINTAARIVGTKQVLRACTAGKLRAVYLAQDVDTFLYQRVIRACEEARVPVRRVDTMKELGIACGVAVPTAAAGLLRE